MGIAAGLAGRSAVLDLGRPADFWVHHFGATGDGVADDGPAVRAALAAASAVTTGARVRFRPGRYRVGVPPEGSYALAAAFANDLTVEGDNATLVVASPALGGLRLDRCKRCIVRGITIDYDPLPHAVGVIRQLSEEHLVVEFDPRFPLPSEPFFTFADPADRHPTSFGVIFDRATRRLKPCTPDHVIVESALHLGRRLFRLRPRAGTVAPQLTIGDLFVYPVRQYGNAIALFDTSDSLLDDVHIFAANAAAIAAIRSDRARIHKTTIRCADGQRLLSTNADGVHSQDCRVGPSIAGCSFEGMLDDGLNVYGRPLVVSEVGAGGNLLLSGGGDLRAGDLVQVFDPVVGQARGSGRVTSVRSDNARKRWSVHLDTPVPDVRVATADRAADTIFNLDACGSGVTVTNTVYRRHRGISARMRARSGRFENNTIQESGAAAVDLTNSPDWPEGPAPANINVVGNRIEHPNAVTGHVALDIGTRALDARTARGRLAHDITVADNIVRDWRGVAILIAGARDIIVRSNRLEVKQQGRTATAGVWIGNTGVSTVERLTVSGDVPVAVALSPQVDIGDDGVAISDVRSDDGTAAILREPETPECVGEGRAASCTGGRTPLG